MRRSEEEIADRAEIDAIIRRSRICRLGLSDGGQPYVVPLCFGYDGTAVYLHCATAGRKLEVLRRNPGSASTSIPEQGWSRESGLAQGE